MGDNKEDNPQRDSMAQDPNPIPKYQEVDKERQEESKVVEVLVVLTKGNLGITLMIVMM